MKRRLFLGIPIPEEIKSRLISIRQNQNLQNEEQAKVKWVPDENYHITISFFGYVPEENIDSYIFKLKNIANATTPFNLTFDKIILAPPNKSPKMIWALFDNNIFFNELVKAVEDNVNEYHRQKDFRRMHSPIPHITLARFRFDFKAEPISFNPLDLSELPVNKFILYESRLFPSGPVYSALSEFSLPK